MSKLMPVTDELLREVERLAYQAAAEGASLAVLPVLLLSLVGEVRSLRNQLAGAVVLPDPTAGTCPECHEVAHDRDCRLVGDGRPSE